jgi:hypothetical protein
MDTNLILPILQTCRIIIEDFLHRWERDGSVYYDRNMNIKIPPGNERAYYLSRILSALLIQQQIT